MKARIVLIEDNPENQRLMLELLRHAGHSVTAVGDGESGLDAVARERPDLVICDAQLPRLSGYEVARRLRTDPCLRGIPLVSCTAFAMVGDRDRSLDAGFDGYITKPIDVGRFVQQVEAFLPAAPPGTRPSAEPASS